GTGNHDGAPARLDCASKLAERLLRTLLLGSDTGAWIRKRVARSQRLRVTVMDVEEDEKDRGALLGITGLPAAGKSALALRLWRALGQRHASCCVLDGDCVRQALEPKPGYDAAGRDSFYATLARLAALLVRQGLIVIVAATAHERRYRE